MLVSASTEENVKVVENVVLEEAHVKAKISAGLIRLL